MEKHFEIIKQHCSEISRISEKVIDNFLMNFVAERENFGQKMNHFSKKYKHIIRLLPGDFFSRVIAEYIIGQTFMPNGLIHKYLNHATIKSLDKESTQFLEYQYEHPWRYCFARIIDHPEKEFFTFYDEFVNDEFLLYSPGVEAYYKANHEDSLYFMLISFNGECWQSYGVIIPFRSFSADDIYFYGTEVFPEVESDESLMDSVHQNPMPYFMLTCGMEYPVTVSKDHVLRQHVAENEVGKINTENLRKVFNIQWNNNIYKISHKEYSSHPHFAFAYYNEETGVLIRNAMTYYGFIELSKLLQNEGLTINLIEDYSVGMSMTVTMKQILKRSIILDEFERNFPDVQEDKVDDETLAKLNHFMEKLLPYINSGQKPDIKKLAEECNLDFENAQGIYDLLKSKGPHD